MPGVFAGWQVHEDLGDPAGLQRLRALAGHVRAAARPTRAVARGERAAPKLDLKPLLAFLAFLTSGANEQLQAAPTGHVRRPPEAPAGPAAPADLAARTALELHTAAGEPCGAADECPICLAPYQCRCLLRRLPCGHAFHAGCVDNWLQRCSVCPVCRAPL